MSDFPLTRNETGTESESARARRLAEQYGFDFIDDLDHFTVDHELFKELPLDLMIRYQFIPAHRENGHVSIVVGDPTDVLKLDEIEHQVGSTSEDSGGKS